MTRHHARAARREREAAARLGTERVHRRRGERAPDVLPVRLPCGVTLVAEVKTRARLPALLRHALTQAAGYLPPPAVPVVVFSGLSEPAHVCLSLDAFARLVGTDAVQVTDNDQGVLALRPLQPKDGER